MDYRPKLPVEFLNCLLHLFVDRGSGVERETQDLQNCSGFYSFTSVHDVGPVVAVVRGDGQKLRFAAINFHPNSVRVFTYPIKDTLAFTGPVNSLRNVFT